MENLMRLVKVTLLYIKKKGFLRTLHKIFYYPFNKFNQKKLDKIIFSKNSRESVFTKIYKLNYWKDNESISGSGSNLESTKNLRLKLPELINEFKINSILDAPCGDFYWMKYIVNNLKINYMGGDIVNEIIVENNKKYKSSNINFQKIDIINDKLPDADLIICRDCLFHFSYEDIFKFFENFINSNIDLILTTSHNNIQNDKFFFENKDILTGDFRKIDLFSEPFNFQKNYLLAIEDKDSLNLANHKYLYLFSKEQIKKFVKLNN